MNPFRKILGLLPPTAFVATLLLPLAQTAWSFAPAIGLGGKVAPEPADVAVSLASWHSGALQDRIEARLVNQLGLRDWMVRLDNEWKYSLLGVTKRPVICGPGGWLYEEDYLTSAGHLNAAWAKTILERVHTLWLAQQVLAENGVTLVLVLSPSKVETYPEHLPFPHDLVYAAGHPHSLDLMRAIFDLGYLNVIDAQRLFTQWHQQEPEARLFHRNGTHWSHPGCARVVVQLLDYMERLSGVDLVNVDLTAIQPPAVKADNDLLELSNLLFVDERAAEVGDIGRAVLTPRAGEKGKPPGVLLVATSFGWLLLENLQSPRICQPMTMHYYFRTAYDIVDGRMSEKRDVDTSPAALRAEILRHRFVVIEWNAAKFLNLFGFPEAVLAAFGQPKKLEPGPISPAQLQAIERAVTGGKPAR